METSANGSHPKPTEDNPPNNLDNGHVQRSPIKNQSFLKTFERLSKRSLKKPRKEEEPDSPKKPELDQNVRSSRVFPDKSVFRLSKRSPNKVEKKEDASSPKSKELPEETASLVGKWRRSIKGKKRIEYNGAETNAAPEEPGCEEEEELQMLSVMEINGLIQSKEIKKAFKNIKFMEDKLLEEICANDFHENVTEFTIRGRDVDLLYGSLFNMVRSIVKDSLLQDHVDVSLVSSVVYLINKEAETHKTPVVTPANSEIPLLGQPRGWKRLWKEAVKDSVSNRIESLAMTDREDGWFVRHLENLQSITVKDMKNVKKSLSSHYPEDYDVCATYARSFHEALASHLQKNVIPLASELSQLYCLLDWIVNQYRRDDFMGHPELQAEINPLSLQALLEGECLENLKKDYNRALQETIRKYLNNILEMEKRNWENGEEVEELVRGDSCHLPIYTDIEEMIGTHVRQSATLSEDLETSAFIACIKELGKFTTRLQAAFQDNFSTGLTDLFVQYTVIYVNSFTKLRHNTTQSDAEECRCAENSLNSAVKSLRQHFFRLFVKDTKPQFQKLITENWLKNNTTFNAIMKSTGILCRCLKYLLPPHDKDFACGIHHYLVKEYITQIMKRKLRLNHLRRKKAAQKMREEGDLINKAADDMGSNLNNLHYAIHCISEILGVKKSDDIKPKLEELFNLYPDISQDHVLCILHLYSTRKKGRLLEHFQKLQQPNPSPLEAQWPRLFSEIECSTQAACFPLCGYGAAPNLAKDDFVERGAVHVEEENSFTDE
ncbi:exocyst complex component 3-like protein 4 [Hyla sarda]|uniref:exocyst complex component 3-like protein 4 n=1 Tax=Hyla sarda TaxID=327740 RepID=UPI0024C3BFD2|nr:exocyst complex component 3-like protein 4 [Hyla sarda]XP_056401817.1 exocyst complex component 3-like protein 4 [Hyla sarda]XP_056401818.1 exocyst complex component 3-like protein 4 [Hyla sarda]